MVEDARQAAMFPTLAVEKIRDMCLGGDERAFADGEALFTAGEANYPFFVVLEGQVRISRPIGSDEVFIAAHGPGQFTGEISMLTGAPSLANGRADGPVKALRFNNSQFRRMIADCPHLAEPVLKAFAARAREVDASMVQQEKLAALGKLAAGLAHELNNPAAAMVRTVQSLRTAISGISKLGIAYDCRFDAAERPIVEALQKEVREGALDPETLTPLERSDREEQLSEWLTANGLEDGWEMAPGLVNAGVTLECIGDLSGRLKPETLAAALTWVAADLTTAQLAKELESASCRISDLVLAMKQYTYMDQAKFQEIDIHAGLESTLKIFSHRMRGGIEVRRDYDRSLPKIPAFVGELNQVWTNLISNAVDAMAGSGVLTVKTARDGDSVLVIVGDSGPGIPEQVRAHMFEPFVTSKPAGQGTGLGLETIYRVVVNRHGGKIHVESKPGDTRFEIRLPIAGPKRIGQ